MSEFRKQLEKPPFLEANVDEAGEELVGGGGLPVVGYAQHLEDRLGKKQMSKSEDSRNHALYNYHLATFDEALHLVLGRHLTVHPQDLVYGLVQEVSNSLGAKVLCQSRLKMHIQRKLAGLIKYL